MDHKKVVIIPLSERADTVATAIMDELSLSLRRDDCAIVRYNMFDEDLFRSSDAIIFIGAVGICVRAVSPFLSDKRSDPAVVVVDSTAKYVVPILSGHIGGANILAKEIAGLLGAIAVITTQSDNTDLWALDLLAKRFGWKCNLSGAAMNRAIISFVNRERCALLIECRDKGVEYLEASLPDHVTVCNSREEVVSGNYSLLIAVTYHSEEELSAAVGCDIPALCYYPQVLNIGVGCRKDCDPSGIEEYILQLLCERGLSKYSVKSVSTIDLKKDEPLIASLVNCFNAEMLNIYSPEDLRDVQVPNPSEKVLSVTGAVSVAEASSILASGYGHLVLEKQKGAISKGNDFTVAVAIDQSAVSAGYIEIVGAGPGDPELISVRGRRLLERANLILYAGSLVPIELTYYAKNGATVRSSASMTLEEQFEVMKEFYDRGKFIVRLHTGDPCIYGAIQEQMAFFDKYGMKYGITPGISSFQAAAAALKSQFTIPEKVQTIILTRGEGATPMPERERLRDLARSRSTMCIFLSAGIVDSVQSELLLSYPPDTPVAACYHLTWKDERIYRGVLKDLAEIVKVNNLTLTTMLVIGEAIDNRKGLSKLYSDSFKHIFRP